MNLLQIDPSLPGTPCLSGAVVNTLEFVTHGVTT